MIRPFTCLCLVAACGSGLYLYSEKHRTAMLDRDISAVIHATEAARARTGLLRAEWALLNEPGRLQDMADKYLALKPMAPTQFVQLSDLAGHLPPVETASAAADPDDGADSATATAAPAAPAHIEDAAAADDTTEIALPARYIAPKPAAKLLARADGKPKPARRNALADQPAIGDRPSPKPHDSLPVHGMPLPLAAPQPVAARVYSALAQPAAPPAYRPRAYSPPPYQRPVAAVPHYVAPYVGSALAGGGALPPPTPYGGDQ